MSWDIVSFLPHAAAHDIRIRMPGAAFASSASPQTFCGKPSSMPPWLGSSQREVTTLPRV